jgi:hypothetical protein
MNPWKHGCPGGGALPSQGLVRANERQHWLRWNVHRNLQLAEFASSGTAAASAAAATSAHSAASRAAAPAVARAMSSGTLRPARQHSGVVWQQGRQRAHSAPPREARLSATWRPRILKTTSWSHRPASDPCTPLACGRSPEANPKRIEGHLCLLWACQV